jgi:hypothetical protein
MQRLSFACVPRTIARVCLFTASLIAGTCVPVHAYAYQDTRSQPDESDLDRHGHYVNRDGEVVHAPARSRSGAVPEGATAQCRDGTYSFSRHHSGTCSRHGGVARWQ